MELPKEWIERADFLMKRVRRNLEEGVYWFMCFEIHRAVSSIILSAVTIRSLLARLYEEDRVSAEAGEKGVLWKLNVRS